MPNLPKEEISQENTTSYHPSLPSTSKVSNPEEYKKLVTTDHIFFTSEVPCPTNTAGVKKIKILSVNFLEYDNGNGFAPAGNTNYGEAQDESLQQARHDNIIHAILAAVENSKDEIDFITFQESAPPHSFLLNKILKALHNKFPDKYGCMEIEEDEVYDYDKVTEEPLTKKVKKLVDNGAPTLFLKTKFSPDIQGIKQAKQLEHKEFGGSITKYKSNLDDNFEIRISSVHHGFSRDITLHEDHLKTFLNNNDKTALPANPDKNTLTIAIGDFNGTVAMLEDDEPKNIITSVAPGAFSDQQVQGAWAIDGCFYSMTKDAALICKQASIKPINPESGREFTKEELAPNKLESFTPEQQQILSEFRQMICVDQLFKEKKLVGGEYTIFDYETYLQSTFDNKNFIVRWAKNLNNEPALGITLPEAFFSFVKASSGSTFQFHHDKEHNQFRVFSKPENIKQLMLALANAKKNQALVELSLAISTLKQSTINKKKVDDEVGSKFDALFQGILKEIDSKEKFLYTNSPYPIIIEHFTNLANDLSKKKTVTVKEIERSGRQLDQKLYGKKPMSTAVRTAICGVIGALVGFTIGAVVGAAFTSWGLGFGAIPGALLGAVTGFTLATGAGLAGSGVGLFASGTIACISGYKKQKQYNNKKSQVNSSIKKEVVDSKNEIFETLKHKSLRK